MVLMDSARNFEGSLTVNFGSCGFSSSFHSEWKSSKLTGFSPHAGCYLSRTSAPESHLLASKGLGTWEEHPWGAMRLMDGRGHRCWLTSMAFGCFPVKKLFEITCLLRSHWVLHPYSLGTSWERQQSFSSAQLQFPGTVGVTVTWMGESSLFLALSPLCCTRESI